MEIRSQSNSLILEKNLTKDLEFMFSNKNLN